MRVGGDDGGRGADPSAKLGAAAVGERGAVLAFREGSASARTAYGSFTYEGLPALRVFGGRKPFERRCPAWRAADAA